MKKGAILLNFSRGELANTADVKAALASGQLGGYVTDFPCEELLGVEKVTCIPHLGASTLKARTTALGWRRRNCATISKSGSIRNSVNLPDVPLGAPERPCAGHPRERPEYGRDDYNLRFGGADQHRQPRQQVPQGRCGDGDGAVALVADDGVGQASLIQLGVGLLQGGQHQPGLHLPAVDKEELPVPAGPAAGGLGDEAGHGHALVRAVHLGEAQGQLPAQHGVDGAFSTPSPGVSSSCLPSRINLTLTSGWDRATRWTTPKTAAPSAESFFINFSRAGVL